MTQYFDDPRFQDKKPKPCGLPEEQCGDNLYFQDEHSQWKRLPSRFHNDRRSFLGDVGKDQAGRPVFVSEHFYYFGRRRVVIPEDLEGVIWDGRNVRDRSEYANDFVTWLESSFEPGILGAPRDMADHASEVGEMIIGLSDGQIFHARNQECGSSARAVTATHNRGKGCG